MRIHINRFRVGPQLDMTPDGRFLEPPAATSADKLLRFGLVVAAVAGAVALAALAFWLAVLLIPVAILGAGIAYAAFRWRLWKAGGSFRGGPPGPTFGS
jgi:hypothetical protein